MRAAIGTAGWAMLLLLSAAAQAQGIGHILFLRCASCHAITPGVSGKIGPDLAGVVGRPVASLPGYSYSPALRAQHFVWDKVTLDRWLTDPGAMVPGTAMAFAGLPSATDRQAVIAYLAASGK